MVIGKVVRISSIVINLAKQTNWLTFHLHTIWLITRNDLMEPSVPFPDLFSPLITTQV